MPSNALHPKPVQGGNSSGWTKRTRRSKPAPAVMNCPTVARAQRRPFLSFKLLLWSFTIASVCFWDGEKALVYGVATLTLICRLLVLILKAILAGVVHVMVLVFEEGNSTDLCNDSDCRPFWYEFIMYWLA